MSICTWFACLLLFPAVTFEEWATPAGSAQDTRKIIAISADRIPSRVIATKGTVIRLAGTVPSGSQPTTIRINVGLADRITAEVTDDWVLDWDTGKEAGTTCTANIWKRVGFGEETRIGRITVDFVQTNPFRLRASLSDLGRSIAINIEPTGRLTAVGATVMIDGV